MRTAVIYNFLLEANMMASIAIILMIPARRFLRKPLGNRPIRFAWLLVAVRLLCPLALPNPAINGIRSAFAPDAAIRPIAGQIQVRLADAARDISWWINNAAGRGSAIAGGMDSIVNSTSNGILSLRLMQLYLLGAGLVLCWFMLSNLRFRRRLKADRIEPISGKLLTRYLALCAERGVKPVPVYFTDPLPSACLVGVLRPYIALPLTAAPKEAIPVLTHELCHLKGRDHIWGLIRLLCCAVHWFNPLVWIAAHMSRIDSELACDDRVIHKLGSNQRLAYANVLVLAASRRMAPGVSVLATGMTMTGRYLKTRVNAILHSSPTKKGLALVFAVAACMALAVAFATAEYQASPAIPQTDPSGAGIQAREIVSEEEAVAYAQALWASDYLRQDTDGLSWDAEEYQGVYYVTAGDELNQLAVHFGSDGIVTYLHNGMSRCSDARITQAGYAGDLDTLAMYLLDFVDALSPGASDRIEAFDFQAEESTWQNHTFVTMLGYTYGANDEEDTYSLFTMELSPQVRVVNYSVGIPVSVMNSGVG